MLNYNSFEKNIISTYGERGREWLLELPMLLSTISSKYGITEITPCKNLSYNYVATGIMDQHNVIVKLGIDTKNITREAYALKAFNGFGAVELIDMDEGLLILDRANSGMSLKDDVSNNKIEIACNVMKRIHEAPMPKTHDFPHVKEWLNCFDKKWDMPEYYLEKAIALRDKLLLSEYPIYLLHGDLHHDNILRHKDSWIAIDPKGVVGPAIFETFAFIMDIEKDTLYVSRFFNYNIQSVRDWYFLRVILSICWNLEDNIDSSKFMHMAKLAYPLASS